MSVEQRAAATRAVTALEGEKYLSLTTFRRDGTPIATPVWFATDTNRLLIWTSARSGKAKRLGRNPRVLVSACNLRGRTTGEQYEGRASLLPPEAGGSVQLLLRRKYGITKRLLDAYNSLDRRLRRRPPTPAAYLEVQLL